MPPCTLRKGEAPDSAKPGSILDRIVYRRRREGDTGILHDTVPVPGRLVAAASLRAIDSAASSFDREQISDTAALRCGGDGCRGAPIGWRSVRDRKDGCRIAEVDTDDRLFRYLMIDRFEQSQRECAATGRIDDKVRRKRLAASRLGLAKKADNRGVIGRRHELKSPAARPEHDIIPPQKGAPQCELEQGPGHQADRPAEITLRQNRNTGEFVAKFVHRQQHSPCRYDVLLKARK